MEFKTIKDLLITKDDVRDIDRTIFVLKQSAINEIKVRRIGYKLPIVWNDIESYIKWKFNLTEEDLK